MTTEAARSLAPGHAAQRWVPVALGLAGIALAHLSLLTFDPGLGELEGIEDAFFEPTSASPGVVMLCWLWLLYIRGRRLRGFEGRESPLAGSCLLLVGSGLCLWAHYVGVQTLLIFSLSLLVLASGLLLGGSGALRTLLFPSAFLLLAIPVPTPFLNAVMYPLQLANAAAAGFVLEIVGFEPIVSGDLIFVGERVFQVIESCSGLRTVLTVVMSTCIYTELCWHDRRRTVVLIALSPLVGIVANHLRILTIIFNPYAGIASVHAAQGLAMLVVAVVLIALLDAMLARIWKTPPEPHLPSQPASGTLPLTISGSYAVICMSLAVASLGLTPWTAPTEDLVPLVRIKAELSGWQLTGFKPDAEFLGSVRYDEFIAHRYDRGDAPMVELFVASDRRLDPILGIGSDKTLIPGRGGVPIPVDVDLGAPSEFLDAEVIRLPGELRLVYHWKVGLGSHWQELYRGVLALDRSPLRRPGRAAVVRISTPIEQDGEGLAEAVARLQTFVHELHDDFVQAGVWPGSTS